MLFKFDESSGKLEYVEKIDKSERKEADGFSAMRKFRDLDRRGIENHAGPGGDSLETIHQNTIIEVRVYAKGKVSTVSLDGKLVIWDVEKVSSFAWDLMSVSNFTFSPTHWISRRV